MSLKAPWKICPHASIPPIPASHAGRSKRPTRPGGCWFSAMVRSMLLPPMCAGPRMTDPDQQRRSTGGDSGFSGPADSSPYLKARTALTAYIGAGTPARDPEGNVAVFGGVGERLTDERFPRGDFAEVRARWWTKQSSLRARVGAERCSRMASLAADFETQFMQQISNVSQQQWELHLHNAC